MKATALFFLPLSCAAAIWGQPLPNFIIILADDHGYADIGAYGSGTAPAGDPWKLWDRVAIRTPNLDRMAAEGVRFTSFYSGHSVCTPSRAALLTGAYPARVGFGQGVLFPDDSTGLNPNEITLAELLRARGYATGTFGKWHLGHLKPFLPTSNGFDEYFGIPYSNDMSVDPGMALAEEVVWRAGWTRERFLGLRDLPYSEVKRQTSRQVPLMRGEKITEFPADQATLTRRYTDEAILFIRKSAGKPFFVYLPHSMPHIPLFASEQFKGKSPRGPYGDVIEEMDWNVGRLLDSLKALGVDGNTLVLYTSDNGPWLTQNGNGGTAYPLREGKTTNWEGGMRVPALMRWPGRIPAGTVQAEPAGLIDLFPTLAGLSGGGLPRGGVIDGKDIEPLLEGRPGARNPRGAFYYDLDAVRSGKWKLKDGMLFDLENDIHEDMDLAAANPGKVSELQGLLDGFKTQLNGNKRNRGTLATRILKAGCTDTKAANYTVGAEVDDGSCRVGVAVHSRNRAPEVRILQSAGSVLEIRSSGKQDVRVADIRGKILVQARDIQQARFVLPFSLPIGTYFVTLSSAEGRFLRKVVLH